MSKPQWLIREDASVPVLVALALRELLGVGLPADLPRLRGFPARTPGAASDVLEQQWLDYWRMTIEPLANPASGPLDLVEGFETMVALPVEGADELREAMEPLAASALEYARSAHDRYVAGMRGVQGDGAYRAYASAITDVERDAGRPAHSFELTVQVLPMAQRGIWWAGALSVIVTDSLRRDPVAFDGAIRPFIAELA